MSGEERNNNSPRRGDNGQQGIPLPALAAQAPQQPNLFDLLGKAQQLKVLQQQTQAGQLEISSVSNR
jgi:hypothetical protein